MLVSAGAALGAPAVTVSGEVGQATADSLTLVWTFDLAPGWHLYGPHRNDTGLPPQVDVELPDGWRAGPLQGWPLPHRHVVADLILDHIYEDRLALSQTIHHPPGAETAAVAARVSWLVCNEVCVPGDTTITLHLPDAATARGRAGLAGVNERLPQPLPAGLVEWTWHGNRLTIAAPGASGLTFIPDAEGPTIANLLEGGQAATDRMTLWFDDLNSSYKNVSGVLLLSVNNTEKHGFITIPLPTTTGGTP